MSNQHAANTVEEAILHRHSPRSFTNKEVSAADLKKVFEAARWAASSYNEQPWTFFVGRRGDKTYQRIFDSLVEFNQMWAKSAPVLIFSVANRKSSKSEAPNYYALHDAGAAAAYLMLQAFALGLHTHSMGGFDHEKIRAAFTIPAEYDLGAVTALGYQGDGSELPEQVRKMETAPRERKPLEAIVLADWGTPASL